LVGIRILCWDKYIYRFGASALGWGSPRLQNLELCGKGPWPNSDTLGFGKKNHCAGVAIDRSHGQLRYSWFSIRNLLFRRWAGLPFCRTGASSRGPGSFWASSAEGGRSPRSIQWVSEADPTVLGPINLDKVGFASEPHYIKAEPTGLGPINLDIVGSAEQGAGFAE
jgi:hypothetical protein